MTEHFRMTGKVAEHLAALAHGAELAEANKGDKAGPADAIWCELADAIEIMESGPDRDRMQQRVKSNAGSWKQAGLTLGEARLLERFRAMNCMKTEGETIVSRYSETDRAMVTLGWMRWLSQYDDAVPLHKAAVEILKGDPKILACKLYKPHRPATRQMRHEIKTRTIGAIQAGLRSMEIYPSGEGAGWVSIWG